MIGMGFIAAFLLLSVCVFALPQGISRNEGLSFYGVHWTTVPLYALTLGVYGVSHWQAGRYIALRRGIPAVAVIFLVIAWCLVGLLVTPYTFGIMFHILHDTIGSALFVLQLITAGWIVRESRRGLDRFLLIAQFLAGVAALLSLTGYWQIELASQLAFQLAFVAIVWRYILRVSVRPPRPENK